MVPNREAIWSLLFLSIFTRPDIAFSVIYLSQKLEAPKVKDWRMLKRVFKYLKGTYSYAINYGVGEPVTYLEGYSDTDYGGDIKTRRSISGVLFKYSGGPLACTSKKQQCIALSTTEAEFVAASLAVGEATWLVRIFNEISLLEKPSVLRIDNHSAIQLLENHAFHNRIKHIDINLSKVEPEL